MTQHNSNCAAIASESYDAEPFFRKILPGDGVYQLATFKNVAPEHHIFEDLGKMASAIITLEESGHQVFQACASYHSGENRKAINVRAIKAFWLDLDVGNGKKVEGKGYETKECARKALVAFCKGLELPLPLVVDSGGGIHAYWLLQDEIGAQKWKAVALKLKKLASQRGLLADPSRTADAASILRPPGSWNKKYDPPRQVMVIADASPVALVDFEAILDSAKAGGNDASSQPTKSVVSHAGAAALPSGEAPKISLAEVEIWLRRVDPWCARTQWRNVGFALADAFGEDGRDLFLRWSRGELWKGLA